tara:strand:- start:99 stop:374 length:276 start_codon:yes stop_codon:yes gene_type:complete
MNDVSKDVPETYVPIEELAKHLSLAVTTIRSWVRLGFIPNTAYLKVGNTYRFNVVDVIEALKAEQPKIEPVGKHDPADTQLEFDFDDPEYQ